jgi:two-component system, NtrC family, sensor kinase
MKDRILIIDDNRAIHGDFQKILGLKEQDSELDELEAILLKGDEVSACTASDGCKTGGCQRYEVSSAYQGQEGLLLVKEAVEQNSPFVMAFVDMRMPPGWDGLETIEHLWQADPELQIVICTAFSDHSWDEMTSRFPNEHRLLVLKKPFDVVEVCQLASALCHKWHAEQTTRMTLHNLEDTVNARTSQMRHELDERRKVEAALRISESEFAAIFETASDGIVIINEDAVIVRCNSAVRQMTGLSAEQLTGASFASLLGNVAGRPCDEAFREFLERVAGNSAQEFELKGIDNAIIPVAISTSEFYIVNTRRFTVTLRDMSEQKQLQRDLYQAQKLESIGQLAAGIAHEINTPMQCVSGNVEFLRNCYERLFQVLDNYQEYLEGPELSWLERKHTMDQLKEQCHYNHIREQAPPAIEEAADAVQKVIEIVRAMKAMSHPGTQEKVPTDVNELVRSATTISRNRWKYAAELKLDLNPQLAHIMALPAELNQVMLNLIVNAGDAVLDKIGEDRNGDGLITIRTRNESDGVLIEVEDTGMGIPDDVKERIFDPFFTTKEVGKGTGQGLAISYDVVVNKHGGRISVETVPGIGTTFTVWLPLDAACSRVTQSSARPVAARELANVS